MAVPSGDVLRAWTVCSEKDQLKTKQWSRILEKQPTHLNLLFTTHELSFTMQDLIWTLRPTKWRKVDSKTQSTIVTQKFSSVKSTTSIKSQAFSKSYRTFRRAQRFLTPQKIILSELRALAISSSWTESSTQQIWWLSHCSRNKMS